MIHMTRSPTSTIDKILLCGLWPVLSFITWSLAEMRWSKPNVFLLQNLIKDQKGAGA